MYVREMKTPSTTKEKNTIGSDSSKENLNFIISMEISFLRVRDSTAGTRKVRKLRNIKRSEIRRKK